MVVINKTILTLFLLIPLILLSIIALSLIGYIPEYDIAFIIGSIICLMIWYFIFTSMRVDYTTD